MKCGVDRNEECVRARFVKESELLFLPNLTRKVSENNILKVKRSSLKVLVPLNYECCSQASKICESITRKSRNNLFKKLYLDTLPPRWAQIFAESP
jgi:hypothetical protein